MSWSVLCACVAVWSWHSCAALAAGSGDRALLSGIWQLAGHEHRLVPQDGTAIPFTQEGAAQYRRTAARLARDPGFDASVSKCVPQGIPRSLLDSHAFQIAQSADQMVFVHAVNRELRIVLLQPRHNDPAIWDPSYMGDGIGHWDGATLVIDTTNFNRKTWLDTTGLPHSEQLHTLEHWRVLDGGQQLEDLVDIEDPQIFSRRWSARLLFQRRAGQLVTDWACGERRADLTNRVALHVAMAPAVAMAFSGFWREARGPDVRVGPALGGPLPGGLIREAARGHLKPWVEQRWQHYRADLARGIEARTNSIECLPWAIPGIGIPGGPAYAMDIVMTPGEALFLYQLDHQTRIVYLNQTHLPRLPASYFGHSIARWQGDTLVIDSTGFNDKTEIVDGIAHSSALHVIERLSLPSRDRLEDQVTFEDPRAFTSPIRLVQRFERTTAFQEYVCAENNLDANAPEPH